MMWKWILPVVTGALALGLLLLGAAEVGRLTREPVGHLDRYSLAFGDLHCPPPPGQSAADFLLEVRYLSGLPGQLHVLDANLPRQLAEAFAMHPWVERVLRIEIVARDCIEIQLRYRSPALAVRWEEATGAVVPAAVRPVGRPLVRVVDGTGVLLPANAPSDRLPIYSAPGAPAHPAGHPWGEATVEAAARLAGFLKDATPRLRLASLQCTRGTFLLRTTGGSRILWGHPPGVEGASEASAAQKLARLLAYCDLHGSLDRPDGPYEHDVRPRLAASSRPMP